MDSSLASKSMDRLFEYEKFPEDKTEKDLEQHVAPAIRVHMLDFLKSIADRSKPVADIEQGHISTAACIPSPRKRSVEEEWIGLRCLPFTGTRAEPKVVRDMFDLFLLVEHE